MAASPAAWYADLWPRHPCKRTEFITHTSPNTDFTQDFGLTILVRLAISSGMTRQRRYL
jgi:hypothetical protein